MLAFTGCRELLREDHRHLKKRDALELPPRLTQLRRTVEGALPRVRIEDLLTQVDAWCDFTRVFRRPGDRARLVLQQLYGVLRRGKMSSTIVWAILLFPRSVKWNQSV